jgi:hypothetical protein
MTFVIQEGAGGCPPLGNVVSAVGLAAMRDSDYEDDKPIVLDRIDDSIGAFADAVESPGATS